MIRGIFAFSPQASLVKKYDSTYMISGIEVTGHEWAGRQEAKIINYFMCTYVYGRHAVIIINYDPTLLN